MKQSCRWAHNRFQPSALSFQQELQAGGGTLSASLDMELTVECYAGYRADERPQRFSFPGEAGARMYEVQEVLDQWYGVGYRCFKVRAQDGNIYIIRHQEVEDRWLLDSFRRA